MMRIPTERLLLLLALIAAGALSGGCTFGGANEPTQLIQQEGESQQQIAQIQRRRLKPPINTSRNLYEGSLWRGASSWGNLLRDHRARYRGDLLTVIEMQKIIKVPEVKPEQAAGQAAPEQAPAQQPKEAIDPILAFLKEQEKQREEIDKEQNDILRSIDSIELEVVRVLSNGNMVVRGVHPPIFRDQNRVKYIVTLNGLVRPSDVDENNNVLSTKISKAEYKVHRLVSRAQLPLGSVARAAGRPKEGALLDRLTDFVASPGTGDRTTQVSPK